MKIQIQASECHQGFEPHRIGVISLISQIVLDHIKAQLARVQLGRVLGQEPDIDVLRATEGGYSLKLIMDID